MDAVIDETGATLILTILRSSLTSTPAREAAFEALGFAVGERIDRPGEVQERLRVALSSGGDRSEVLRRVARTAGRPRFGISSITVDLMAHHGLSSIDAALLLEATNNEPDFRLPDRRGIKIYHSNLNGMRVIDATFHLTPTILWMRSHNEQGYATLYIDQSLPRTMCAALAGRPLTEVFRHDVLDRHALTIARIDPWSKSGSAICVAGIPPIRPLLPRRRR